VGRFVNIREATQVGSAEQRRQTARPSPSHAAAVSHASSQAQNPFVTVRSRAESWLALPLSGGWCALGWCAATICFISTVALFGGPALNDTSESVYGTWAVAHFHMACAYPPVAIHTKPAVAPVYLLVSGGIAAIAHFGGRVPFPSSAVLGPGCHRAPAAIARWSIHAGALVPTTWIGYVGWIGLMVGVVAFLRASGRGRCGWEPATLILLAVLPPVWECLQLSFHPQDLLAMGFALAAIACACRGRWIGAGILIAVAILTQQFALLVAAPLLVLAPSNRRAPYAGAAVATGILTSLPFLLVSGGHALRAIALGTVRTGPSIGGTVLWELHLYGAPEVLLSRVAPVTVSVALSWWVARRLGPAALAPATLISVVALSLGLRLVFEQNMFSYYFMALAVALLLLDVVRGYVRSATIAWLFAVVFVFCLLRGASFQWLGLVGYVRSLDPFVFLVPALVLMLLQTSRGRTGRNMWPWLGIAVCALLLWPGHGPPHGLESAAWFWQVVLVGSGMMLAAGPLLGDMRRRQSGPRHRDARTLAVPRSAA
jgi:hypothetical protein